MSYDGDSLVSMVNQLEVATNRTGRRLAEAMQDRGKHNITANTPVETLHLRESYKRTPIIYKQTLGSIRWSAWVWEGQIYTEVEYAPYVELGTGLWGPKRKKYKIAPKQPGGVLMFTPYDRLPNGGVVLDVQGKLTKVSGEITVRFVMHPGSPGQHMFKIGTTLTEAEFNEWSAYPMQLWKAEVESKMVFPAPRAW